MKKQIYEIYEDGYIKEIYVIEIDEIPFEELSEDIIIQDPPNGLYKAKWNGTQWVEGLDQCKLDEIEYQQYLDSLKPSDEDIKKAQMELLVMNLLFDMEVM